MILPNSRAGRRLKVVILALDIIGIWSAYFLVLNMRLSPGDIGHFYTETVFIFLVFNLFSFYLFDLYKMEPQVPLWKKPLETLGATSIAACAIVLIAYFLGAIEFKGLIGRGVLIGAQITIGFWAASWRFVFSKLARITGDRTKWLVLTNEENQRNLTADLKSSKLVGQFCVLVPDSHGNNLRPPLDANSQPNHELTQIQVAGTWSEFKLLSSKPWTGIIAAADNLPDSILEQLMERRFGGVRVFDLTDFYEQTWSKVPVFFLRRSWFALSQGFHLLHNPIGLRVKRTMDFLCATVLLVLASPIMALAAAAIKLESEGPAMFKQTRVGENGKLFTVLKLRSMRMDAEKDGARWASVKDSRVTKVGSFIRATRIDELPQLLCVLKGEMSFIGPRPERPEFTQMLEREIPFYNMRHLLRPGVTGWAQVMYPYGSSVEDARQKLQFDLYYVKNYSLLLDAAIILKTIRVVLFGKGR